MTLAVMALAGLGLACAGLIISLAALVRLKARFAAEARVRRDLAADLAQAKEREEHVRLLLNEMAHRSKNTLAVAQVIAQQTANTTDSKRDFIGRFTARLQAFATAHALLLDENQHGANIEDVVRGQLGHCLDLVGVRIFLAGASLTLPPAMLQMLGLALHELATNAVKYGALSSAAGRVDISWTIGDAPEGGKSVTLSWIETEGPLVTPPQRRGFGAVILERIAPQAVKGRADLRYDRAGLQWRLTFPEPAANGTSASST
ncbi:sensor histidine kinase [Roseiarcaceae bacterium H3SJ34-1]|uniref:HWE histidine kinase domain-containing protein n=1 Tax=Terripilifer ovatus TaxID=3032367 RepID=UPI003AB93F03|nr:sensor histidine kinase [Roseiarcaceae bacterium H3SJ34-1]